MGSTFVYFLPLRLSKNSCISFTTDSRSSFVVFRLHPFTVVSHKSFSASPKCFRLNLATFLLLPLWLLKKNFLATLVWSIPITCPSQFNFSTMGVSGEDGLNKTRSRRSVRAACYSVSGSFYWMLRRLCYVRSCYSTILMQPSCIKLISDKP